MSRKLTVEEFLKKPWVQRANEPVPFEYPYWANNFWDKLRWIFGFDDNWVDGEIKVGEYFIWEPGEKCRERLKVAATCFNGTEWWILTESLDKPPHHPHFYCMNNADRFREACIRY